MDRLDILIDTIEADHPIAGTTDFAGQTVKVRVGVEALQAPRPAGETETGFEARLQLPRPAGETETGFEAQQVKQIVVEALEAPRPAGETETGFEARQAA